MASLVVAGDVSGSVTLSAPSAAGSTVITLPTTSGTMVVTGGAQTVQFAAGSAASPSITFTGDTNTGIFSPAADTIAFSEGGVESMRIDSSGRVGIGETTPNNTLSIKAAVATTLLTSSTGTNTVYTQYTNTGGSFYVGRDNSTGGTFGAIYGSYLYSEGAYPLVTWINGSERMRITSAGNVGIGTTNPGFKLQINVAAGADALNITDASSSDFQVKPGVSVGVCRVGPSAGAIAFQTDGSERMRLTSGGDICFAKTASDTTTLGGQFTNSGSGFFYFAVTNTTSTSGQSAVYINRQVSDGELITFRQADTTEGNISVSGTTVSYNGGHLSRWSQLPNNQKDDTLLKGTVMSNLDDMCVWVKDGETLPNEQLNKMKVSDVEGDTNVAGVFVNWTFDEQCQSDDMNVAMTGDMIIRIAQGVVVQKGDLLMSAGDGTAKPQGDDIRRSKTVAKVTSNHVTCTYEDGSYCVPCVLMAC